MNARRYAADQHDEADDVDGADDGDEGAAAIMCEREDANFHDDPTPRCFHVQLRVKSAN